MNPRENWESVCFIALNEKATLKHSENYKIGKTDIASPKKKQIKT